MRILHLSKFDLPERGGVEKVAHELCVGLQEIGVISDMLAISETMQEFQTPYRLFRDRITLKCGSAPFAWGYVKDYVKQVKSYNAVHLHHPNPLASLLICLIRPKILVVHWHSDIIRQKYSYLLFRYLERFMLKRADAVIVTSPPYLLSSNALSDFQNKISIIPIGIEDSAQENFDEVLLKSLKSKYQGKKVVFSLGRLIYYKGYEYLIDAAQFIPEDTVILIGGSGPLKQALQERIDALGVGHKVKLLGYLNREACIAHYKHCDVFCMSSIEKTEAFGVVQIEAMCFSKPIISTRIPGSGVDWVNADGVSGLTVERKSAPALAQAITDMFADKIRYEDFAQQARARFESLFKREKMAEDTKALYARLLMGAEHV